MCDDVEPNFDAMNDGVEPVMIDLTDVFTTGMIFDTRDELLKWARNVGRENRIVVVIFRSETTTTRPRTKTKLILGCERSGKYRPWKNPNLTRSTWTRKCDCPFRLRGIRSNVDDRWYRMPLLEIIGVTSTEMTFCVGFAYLQSERLDNFTWALQMNVKAKRKMIVFPKKKQVQIMEAWEALIYSYDEAQYYMKLAIFEGIWLIPHKERFVEAWTNRVMHFGNTTTQRVESAHWSLKRILQDSIGDICSVWETINSMIVLQHNEIIASFEKSIIQKVH
ncbi:uncharacterized protein [Cicer arietinum]|uniref:Uncharacterized protein LOC101505975 n=1 Tax=Cicer arietinum TaxID=3827 RepID=A0A1S2Z322_CICAR|nr:uncharacterized protein LOC101505975 [Cicer arietinum]